MNWPLHKYMKKQLKKSMKLKPLYKPGESDTPTSAADELYHYDCLIQEITAREMTDPVEILNFLQERV